MTGGLGQTAPRSSIAVGLAEDFEQLPSATMGWEAKSHVRGLFWVLENGWVPRRISPVKSQTYS